MEDLETFVAVIESGSQTAAARRLGRSLQSVNRSLLALENLVSAIDTVLAAAEPLRRALIVADPEPLTIADMIASLRLGLRRKPGLIPVPPQLLELALRATGRAEIYQRLAGSLVADPSALMRLGWVPRVTSVEGLRTLVRG